MGQFLANKLEVFKIDSPFERYYLIAFLNCFKNLAKVSRKLSFNCSVSI